MIQTKGTQWPHIAIEIAALAGAKVCLSIFLNMILFLKSYRNFCHTTVVSDIYFVDGTVQSIAAK